MEKKYLLYLCLLLVFILLGIKVFIFDKKNKDTVKSYAENFYGNKISFFKDKILDKDELSFGKMPLDKSKNSGFLYYSPIVKSPFGNFLFEDKDSIGDYYKENFYENKKRFLYNKIWAKNNELLLNKILLEKPKNSDFLYYSPIMESPFRNFLFKNKISVDINFEKTRNGFDSVGKKLDYSWILFNTDNIKISDVLLVSRLLNENFAEALLTDGDGNPISTQNSYFYILADQELQFKANIDKTCVDIAFNRHFLKDKLNLGFNIPLIKINRSIHLTSRIDAVTSSMLRNAAGKDNFYNSYLDLESFLDVILAEKGISYSPHLKKSGIGDLSLFINYNLVDNSFSNVTTGMSIKLPISKKMTTDHLWNIGLDNGEYVSIKSYLSLYGHYFNKWFNPHIFLELEGGFSSTVKRRVPKVISYDGITPPVGYSFDEIVFGETKMTLKLPFNNELETYVPQFAKDVIKVSYTPPIRFALTLGSVIKHIFSDHIIFDSYYKFDLKLKDSHRVKDEDEFSDYRPHLLDRPRSIKNILGFKLDYQINNYFRANINTEYNVWGLNSGQTFIAKLGISYEF